MTEAKQKTKKISRRDAIKLLGAVTGATVLANLPSKWRTPEIARGVLPAHAQTSSLGLTINCTLTTFILDINTGSWESEIYVEPIPLPIPMIMQFTMTFSNTHLSGGSEPQPPLISNTSVDQTDGIGSNAGSDVHGDAIPDSGQSSGSVTILWEFTSPSIGTGTCSKTVPWLITPR